MRRNARTENSKVAMRESAADGREESGIEATMMDLVARRGADKTVCPSEVARHLGGSNPDDWRPLMQPVRRVAVRLAKQGKIAILRKGVPVADPGDLKGIYRLGMPRGV